MGEDSEQTFSVSDLMKIIIEKDKLITELLVERNKPAGAVSTFQIMPDLSKAIRDFTAEGDSALASDWLENLNRTATLHKWPPEFKLETANSHLAGPALDWFRSRRSRIKSWEDFETRFRRSFVSQTNAAERYERMKERIQQRNETTTAYFHAKVRLCTEARLDFQETREQVLVGLRSSSLCSMLMGRTHDDEDDLLHDIEEYERVDRQRQERLEVAKASKKEEFVQGQDPGQTDRKKSTGPPTKDTRPPLKNDKGELKCYNCNNYGHIARDCAEPRRELKCLRCRKSGHTQRHCKEEANLVANFEGKGHGPPLKLVVVDDKAKVVGLVDTGSSSCIMRASAASRCGAVLEESDMPLYGFGSVSTPAARTLGSFSADLEIDGVTVKMVPILVVADEVQSVDLLVGRTFTEMPNVTYGSMGGCIRFWSRSDCPFRHLEPTLCDHMTLRVTEDTELKAEVVNWVSLSADSDLTGPVIVSRMGKEVLVDMCEGKVSLPVFPSASEDVVVKKGQQFGRAEPVNVLEEVLEEAFTPTGSSENAKRSEAFLMTAREPISLQEVDVGGSTTCIEKVELLQLLNEYRDCFAMNMEELGCTPLLEMDIKEVPGSSPVAMRPYKTNMTGRETMKKIVREWRARGIVTDTHSPYASPVLLVTKKSGEERLVVDYRRLNAQTIKEKYPLPSIDDQLESLSGAKLYTVLDLAHGYLQVPLSESAKEKTAFITPDETGQFERMMFGLSNAPAVFQRLMNRVLGTLKGSVALCYLDDILIPAKDWKELISRLRSVLQALREANLTLRLSKCAFGKDSVDFLGFHLKNGEIHPGYEKVRAINKFPRPMNVHEVRGFLGLTGFFRRFIQNYARIAEPLTRLTKKHTKFQWGSEQDESFEQLKQKLTSEPVLALYDPDAETELHTDASSKGLAAMLLQRREGSDKWRLVYCVSKKTTEAESKYHSSKLELMAIVWAVDRLRSLLLGLQFTVVTDCQALVYMNAQRTTKPQIARWYDMIQEFDFSVRHRSGTRMLHVDSLSRSPVEEPSETLDNIVEARMEVLVAGTIDDQMLTVQRGDRELRELIDILERPCDNRTANEAAKTRGYALCNSKLMRKGTDEVADKVVVPKSMRKAIVVRCHDLQGHFSTDRTVAKIKEKFWFPRMRRYVRRHISQCFECIYNKVPGGKKPGLLNPIPPGNRPFEVLHLDHLGPFARSKKKNQYLLVIVDNLTKFVRLFATRDTSVRLVLRALEEMIWERGLPRTVITDRGSCFTSKVFEEFCAERTIKHVLNSTRHPQANGQVERVNRTVMPVIAAHIEDPEHRDWDGRLREIESFLNNAVNKTTNRTPFELIHGYTPDFYAAALQQLVDPAEERKDPNELREKARERILKEQEESKHAYDRRHFPAKLYGVGEVVFMRRGPEHTGEPTKTQAKYRGPLVVTQVLPADTYRVAQLGQPGRRRFATTAHASQLKGWSSTDETSHLEDDELSSEEGSASEEDQVTVQLPRRSTRKRTAPS